MKHLDSLRQHAPAQDARGLLASPLRCPRHLARWVTVGSLSFCACSTESASPGEGDDPTFPSGGALTQATGGGSGSGSGAGTGGGLASGGDQGDGGGASSSGGGSSTAVLIIEEEQPGHCSLDGIVESSNSGFSGAGYLNTDNAVGSSITWSVQVAQEGTYTVTFFYANAGEDRPAELLIDDGKEANVSFPTTADWAAWATVTATLTLAAGSHSISLQATGAGGLSNIDRIEVSGASVEAGECEPDEGPDGSEPITIWLAGDSTVANGPSPCPSGWGKFFGSEFNENVTVDNRAVGGRSVRTWLYDVTNTMGGDGECVLNTNGSGDPILQSRWTDMLTQMKAGDYLFIQFGINDGSSTCPRHVGGQAFKEEYAMMANAAFERGVQPVFLTPVSAIKCSGSTAVGSRGFLTETFDVGAAEDVLVIDLHQLSVNLYQELDFCPVPGGDVSAGTSGPVGDFFCDDHTHFSDVGGAEIASLVADAVENSDLGLAAYLK